MWRVMRVRVLSLAPAGLGTRDHSRSRTPVRSNRTDVSRRTVAEQSQINGKIAPVQPPAPPPPAQTHPRPGAPALELSRQQPSLDRRAALAARAEANPHDPPLPPDSRPQLPGLKHTIKFSASPPSKTQLLWRILVYLLWLRTSL